MGESFYADCPDEELIGLYHSLREELKVYVQECKIAQKVISPYGQDLGRLVKNATEEMLSRGLIKKEK